MRGDERRLAGQAGNGGRRILVIVGSLTIGGCERHLLQVLPRLLRQGFEPTVYVLTEPGELAAEMVRAGVPVIGGLARSPSLRRLPVAIRAAAVIRDMVRSIRRLRPDIVHSFLPEACVLGGFATLLAGHARLVVSRRSLNDYQHGRPLFRRVESWIMRRACAVLGNSRAIVDQLRQEGMEEGRLGLIYSGLDLSASPPEQAALRQREGISADTFVLAIVANLHPYKGHADLLRALASVKDRLPQPWQLLCVGQGVDGQQERLEQYAHQLGIAERVRFTGARNDAADLWRIADVGLLVSHQEGFSLALLEAMSAGLPTVVTNVGGNAEAVIDGGCGTLVPPRDEAALAAAIMAYAGDPDLRARHGAAARERILSLFTLEKTLDGYASLYRGLVRPSGRNVQAMIDGALHQ